MDLIDTIPSLCELKEKNFNYPTYYPLIQRVISNHYSEIVKKKLDNYVDFDIDEIYKYTELTFIFGGAITDSISGRSKINDVDILTSNADWHILISFLKSKKYSLIENGDPFLKDKSDGYFSCEPDENSGKNIVKHIKVEYYRKDNSIINVITAKTYGNYKKSHSEMITSFLRTDIMENGIYYNGKKLIESYSGAIISSYLGQFTFIDYKENGLIEKSDRYKNRSEKYINKNYTFNGISKNNSIFNGEDEKENILDIYKKVLRKNKIDELNNK